MLLLLLELVLVLLLVLLLPLCKGSCCEEPGWWRGEPGCCRRDAVVTAVAGTEELVRKG